MGVLGSDLKSWAWLLAIILEQVEVLVAVTDDAQKKKQTVKEVEGMANI